MMKRIAVLLLFLVPMILSAQTVKPSQPIRFQIKNAGLTVDGTLSEWEIEMDFDAKRLDKSSIKGSANPGSIDTGIKLRDKHLQGRQYFYTEKFPLLSLQSQSLSSKGKGAFVGVFDLRIRDVVKQVEIPFTVSESGKQKRFKGSFTIDRLEYGIGEKSLVLADEVLITIEF